jgi:hypothetical protein
MYPFFPAALGPEVYSASSRNEYQKHKNVSGSKARQAGKADNLAAICEPIIWIKWDP